MNGSRQNDSRKNTPNKTPTISRCVERPRQGGAVAVTETLEHMVEPVVDAPDETVYTLPDAML